MEDSFGHNDDLSDAEKHPFLGSIPPPKCTRAWSTVRFVALLVLTAVVFTAGRWSISSPVTFELPTGENAGRVPNCAAFPQF